MATQGVVEPSTFEAMFELPHADLEKYLRLYAVEPPAHEASCYSHLKEIQVGRHAEEPIIFASKHLDALVSQEGGVPVERGTSVDPVEQG